MDQFVIYSSMSYWIYQIKDCSILTRNENGNLITILASMGDIDILSHSQNVLKVTKSKSSSKFNMKDLGELSNFLVI